MLVLLIFIQDFSQQTRAIIISYLNYTGDDPISLHLFSDALPEFDF
jgi:hypothetical protein